MDAAIRHKMGSQAIQLAQACGYYSTGTVEFLMDKNKDFYFLEMNTRLQVEHPITEEITGVDLVEQQLLIAAGHKLSFTQDDIKIHGHSMEYRVYAEDPSRKFLPSIGFLKKYKEPNVNDPNKRVRIDTGVEEGSEISMYYDPMISKLITWGKDREESMVILDRAFDEYVIQGVTHNIEFGKSILASEAYWTGNYSTAFIPENYPNGFSGDKLDKSDLALLAVSAHQVKNIHLNYGKAAGQQAASETLFVTIDSLGDDQPEVDFKVRKLDANSFEITNMNTSESQTAAVDDFSFEYQSLISLKLDSEERMLQFAKSQPGGINFTFNLKGNSVDMRIYSEDQYKYKQYMPVPVKIDSAKSIISPMPGAIVEVFVQPGDAVVEGQQLCIIEAMKMQNIIKAEIAGKIKEVNVKSGDSVAVDELLIQFE